MGKINNENRLQFGISMQMIIEEALAQEIEVVVADKEAEVLRLQKNGRTEYIEKSACTSADNYMTILLMDNKLLCNRILAKNGISVLQRGFFANHEKAKSTVENWTMKEVVVKPKSADQGQGIASADEKWHQAFEEATKYDNHVLVEEYISGEGFRFLVINFKVVAVVRRTPPYITGDGIHTIEALIQVKNARAENEHKSETAQYYSISLDKQVYDTLDRQGVILRDIPDAGEIIQLRQNSNTSTGGEVTDVTDTVHINHKKIAKKAAKIIGTKLTGLDMLIEDSKAIPNRNNHAIIELNKEPALYLHKSFGKQVAIAILRLIGFGNTSRKQFKHVAFPLSLIHRLKQPVTFRFRQSIFSKHVWVGLVIIFMMLAHLNYAQQIKLQGQVSIHNSKYNTGNIQYVKDAYVSAPFTKADDTDDTGLFALEFVGMDPGMAVELLVEKSGLEIVNKRDLQEVIISRKLPLRIYLTTKGLLTQAQTELYNISKDALYKQKDALIAQLRGSDAESKTAIAELRKKFDQEIQDRFVAEDLLNEKIKALEKRLPGFAMQMAAQNLDFASDMYIEAYEYYKSGNIEKSIATLDNAKLEESYQEAKSTIAEGKKLENAGKDLQEKGIEQIEQLVSSYELKAVSYKLLFQYGQVALHYKKIIEIYQENKLDERKLAHWYTGIAWAYIHDGKYTKALEYYLKSASINKKRLRPEHPELAISYENVAKAYRLAGEYEKALEYHFRAIEIQEEILNPKHPDLAISYNNIGSTHLMMGEYKKAIEYYRKAVEIQEEVLDDNHYDLADSYDNIGIAYQNIGEYPKGLEYLQKSIDIYETILEPNHPDLVISYVNISIIYYKTGDYNESLAYLKKSIDVYEKILSPNHPTLATCYNNISVVYEALEQYEKALEYLQKSLAIRAEVLNPKHPSLATSYSNMGNIYRILKAYSKSLEYHQKSISIREVALGTGHPRLAESYENIGNMYRESEAYNKALEYYQKCMNIRKETLGTKHPDLARVYWGIAKTYIKTEQLHKALKYQEKAVAIFKSALPEDHPDQQRVAETLSEIKSTIEKKK